MNVIYTSPLQNLNAAIIAQSRANIDAFVGLKASFTSLRNDYNNPHYLGSIDVGLGNVPNWAPATTLQAVRGVNPTSFISPLRLDQYMDANVYEPLTQAFQDAIDRLA